MNTVFVVNHKSEQTT